MGEKNIVLCGANSYDKKYYLNDNFSLLPEHIKNELKILCVLFTADIGGILTLEFENAKLCFKVQREDNDLLFDEIGCELKIKQLRIDKQELLESLETYYKVFCVE